MRYYGKTVMKQKRKLADALLLSLIVASVAFPRAQAQAWAPQRNVEFIAPAGAGGAMDTFTRALESVARELKGLPVTSTVSSKPGGEHAVAYNYLQQKAGDPHVLVLCSPVLLTNHISGVLPVTYSDFTPIAMMMSEYLMRRPAHSAELRAMAEKQQWDIEFTGAVQTRKEMEADYERLRRVMHFMGMVK
jgi:hypothetical protein